MPLAVIGTIHRLQSSTKSVKGIDGFMKEGIGNVLSSGMW